MNLPLSWQKAILATNLLFTSMFHCSYTTSFFSSITLLLHLFRTLTLCDSAIIYIILSLHTSPSYFIIKAEPWHWKSLVFLYIELAYLLWTLECLRNHCRMLFYLSKCSEFFWRKFLGLATSICASLNVGICCCIFLLFSMMSVASNIFYIYSIYYDNFDYCIMECSYYMYSYIWVYIFQQCFDLYCSWYIVMSGFIIVCDIVWW